MSKFLLTLLVILYSSYTCLTFASPFVSGPPCADCVLKRNTYAGAQERRKIFNRIKQAKKLEEKGKMHKHKCETARKKRETALNALLKKNETGRKISPNLKSAKTCIPNASGKLICGKVCMKNFHGEVKCGDTCLKNLFGKIKCGATCSKNILGKITCN